MPRLTPTVRLPEPWDALEILTPDERAQLESLLNLERPDSDEYRWDRLRNQRTETEVFVRVHRPRDGRAHISAALLAHGDSFLRVRELRDFPLAAIEAAYVESEVAEDYHLRAMMVGMPGHPQWEVDMPLGAPDGTDGFYGRVSMQFTYLASTDGDTSPAAAMATLNDVSLSTAQRWLTESRRRGFLPPGKPGRRAKRGQRDAG